MKSILLSVAFLCSFFSAALASHYAGNEIRYEYVGPGNVYKVYYTEYKMCSAAISLLPTVENVSFRSTSLNVNITRPFNMQSIDTFYDLICPGNLNACTQAGNQNPGIVTAVFSDTVTLQPAADWYISWSGSARASNVLNLSNPGSQNIYVEAFLNNSTSTNSSAWLVNKPALVTSVNNVNLVPFGGLDYEGDSIVYELVAAQFAVNTSAYYATPYSAVAPISGTAQIVGSSIKLQCNLTGAYALAVRAKDYRSGQLVGYTTRDWNMYSYGVAAMKHPYPMTGNPTSVTTCPGQTQSITLSYSDSVATDSIIAKMVTVNNGVTFTTTSNPGVGTGSITISWTTPSTWNPVTSPHFYIPIYVRNGACPIRGEAFYAVKVLVSQCLTDSVWAGDANKDNSVNVFDPLAVAIAYGQTGPTRPAASIMWNAQYCANWANSFVSSVNMKHADCNGDGVVNAADLVAILANFGLTHPKEGFSSPIAKVTSNPDLYFDLTGITLVPGATVTIPVKLGSSTTMMNNVYGLAAHMRIDGLNFSTAPAVAYGTSWLGTSANTITFAKNVSNNNIAWAYARNDHQNTNGSGTIATVQFTVPANAAIGQQVVLRFENSKLIDKNGAEITAVNILSDTGYVRFPTVVGAVNTNTFNAQIVPNPSVGRAMLSLDMANSQIVQMSITDVAGRVVYSYVANVVSGVQKLSLPAATLQPGMYIITVQTDDAQQQKLKWVKE